MDSSWIVRRGLTVEDVERESHERIRQVRPDWIGQEFDRPFGAGADRWAVFRGKLQPGDELASFRSPKGSWEKLAGRAGYCILRGDRVVATYVTLMS